MTKLPPVLFPGVSIGLCMVLMLVYGYFTIVRKRGVVSPRRYLVRCAFALVYGACIFTGGYFPQLRWPLWLPVGAMLAFGLLVQYRATRRAIARAHEESSASG